ncbi:MAG: LL-diaminopimelate aminotransferase [Rhabdochlamydiaceae bacterium]
MTQLNPSFTEIKREYIFPIIEKKLEELKATVPSSEIINLGIGDIALPLAPSVKKGIEEGLQEMVLSSSLKGYGPSDGYFFLKEAIWLHEYKQRGITADEIFISDGINTDIANIQELFPQNILVGIPDPTYPVYMDSHVLAGRKKGVRLLPCIKQNGFQPQIPEESLSLIYLCTPNNPTGVALSKEELTLFVDYAHRNKCILLIDAAYAAFVRSDDVPLSIYDIPGADEVAIEFKSFSKSAGFTGLRCSYTIIPKKLRGLVGEETISLHTLWKKRQSIKSNGVSYPIQRGAAAVFSDEGSKETKDQVDYYLKQAHKLKTSLTGAGYSCFGGKDSPYIWCETPHGIGSWEFFDILLKKCHLICIPGIGFGANGEGFVRFSAFNTETTINRAVEKLKEMSF